MNLTDHDLRQLDEAQLAALPESALRVLAVKLLGDLKVLRERVNQNPSNSSRPSGSMPAWYSSSTDGHPDEAVEPVADLDDAVPPSSPDAGSGKSPKVSRIPDGDGVAGEPAGIDPKKRRKPGRQPGSQGHGRTQVLPTEREAHHAPERCVVCDAPLADSPHPVKAYTAYYEIDLKLAPFGLSLVQTKHYCCQQACACGHVSRYEPRVECANDTWNCALSAWRLVGPRLASLIVFLTVRMRLSRARVREFLEVWLGLKLNTGTIQQVVDEAARCVEPLEQAIIDEVVASTLLHSDETSWKQGAVHRWLWVVVGVTATWYTIGGRGREAIARILFAGRFTGWLMSDGWLVYREYADRLRCWAHLVRKARGLAESLDREAAAFGAAALAFFRWGLQVIDEARQAGPPQASLYARYNASHLQPFMQLCYAHQDSQHAKTREFAREIGYDEAAIFAVFDFPHLPLTNNAAERALRHWVIMRRLSHGTRTPQGSRRFCLLASLVDTCRQRGASTWDFIADTIRNRRAGLPALALPPATAVAS